MFYSLIDLEVEIAEQVLITLLKMWASSNNHPDYKPFKQPQFN